MRVEIDNVHKSFGSVTALEGVSLEIPSGTTFGLLGTNGAGKTTLFELLVGHQTPDQGGLSVGGIDIATAGANVREHIGFLPEQVGFPGLLTGREVLHIHARIRYLGGERKHRIEEVLETVGISDAADRRVSGYSNGMQTRLGLAAALLSRPPVLVLDEPTAGLDPRGVEAFHRIIERINRERDATVILSSHALHEVDRLCEEVAILHEGRLCGVHTVPALGSEIDSSADITITPATEHSREQIIQTIGSAVELAVETNHIIVSTPQGDVVEVISRLDSDWVDSLEVRGPSLDDAFHDAISSAETDGTNEVITQ